MILAVTGLQRERRILAGPGVEVVLGGDDVDRHASGKQGVIRLTPDENVTLGLGICEGIEDGLSILLSGYAPVWCATSAGAIARFPIIGGIESLTIFADADGPGIDAAGQCLHRWRIAGREATVLPPGDTP